MKSLMILLALTIPSLASAAEFIFIQCYAQEGNRTIETFKGYVVGTSKMINGLVAIEGKGVARTYVQRFNTPDTCASPYSYHQWDDGEETRSDNANVSVFEYDYSIIELTCGTGSVVRRYGDLGNFKKAIEAEGKRAAGREKPLCLDFSGIE